MATIQYPFRYQYEAVAASATAQVLGGTGATGDYLHQLVVSVATAATSTFSIIDGSTTVFSGAIAAGTGCFTLPVMAVSSTGPWKITTGAGVSVLAVGVFSA